MPENETDSTKISGADLHTIIINILTTYPSFIFDVDISSFFNKGLHCVLMAFTSCKMQGSPLRENKFSSGKMIKKLTCPYILDYSVPSYQIVMFTIFNLILMMSC